MKTVISKATELVRPTEKEEERVRKKVEDIIKKVNKSICISRVEAELIVGGSVGKGSWLPGIHDFDFFLVFSYEKYASRSEELSNITERILTKVFNKYTRLHGSRDYFQIKDGKDIIEIIPALKIKKAEYAKNLTDSSPLHVGWVKKHVTKNKQLPTELRLAKKFFKGQQAYGAESFIQGFSGHVIEILTCHYGSFEKLVKAVKGWKTGKVIDIEKHYKSPKDAFDSLNPEKKKSPIIVIDPVESDRNAAASLSEGVFNKITKSCKKFIKKPKLEAFVEMRVEFKDLKKKETKKNKLVAFEVTSGERKVDVAGAQLKKQYNMILRLFTENEFTVLKSNWYWDRSRSALFYYFLNTKELPKKKILRGPLTYCSTENIMAFKNKYKRKRIFREGYNYFVEVPRRLRKISDVLKVIKKDFSNLRLLK